MFDRHRSFQGAWQERPFQKGTMKYVILDLIKDKPRYGYEIIRALEESSHGFYTPSPGAVYPTLQMLEEMRYVSGTEQDGKKVYTLTEEGRQFLSERKDLTDEVKNQMRYHWNPENIDDRAETMREFGRLTQLLGVKVHTMDTKKLRRIRQTISRAYEDISKD